VATAGLRAAAGAARPASPRVRRLDRHGPLDWGQLAADAGYADQAHLIRDFREFTGSTPTDFLAQAAASGPAGAAEVNSVQDAVAAGPNRKDRAGGGHHACTIWAVLGFV
jgi:Bacterial regulatory helix-turn-helix proteins, AraC family